ncbi:hypothetical protein HELRODRAFT_82368 [Helobdella robusta]|uniref:PDZ domain-containing protein n=1 Tax=Helobdella robusta TaxID=6412 RepID=T1G4R3_HELRO|nr:hypothetical protein HELRODRAFT_82368 [Helobdella robusta]ESO01193.1 hypothetical protein HELRODRAFT_82368 [Helobdella robusta]
MTKTRQLNTEWCQLEVINLLNDGTGLGFGIIGGKSTGVVIKTIVAGGVADRDGRLRSGDHILQICDVNVRGLASEQVAAVLRQSGSHVRLLVARSVHEYQHHQMSHIGQVLPVLSVDHINKINTNNSQNTAQEQQQQQHSSLSTSPTDPNVAKLNKSTTITTSNSTTNLATSSAQPVTLTEWSTIEVDLLKDENGLGITVVGYSNDLTGIFIRSIAHDSIVRLDGRLQVNDQIIQVDDKPLKGLTNQESVEILRLTGHRVKLKVVRFFQGSKYEQLMRCSFNNEIQPQHPPQQPQQPQPQQPQPQVGMSLEGTVDVDEAGRECHPHHYIRSIYPRGPIAVNGKLKVGDELLEVNGINFYGMDRMLVVSTLKELPQNVCIVVARRNKRQTQQPQQQQQKPQQQQIQIQKPQQPQSKTNLPITIDHKLKAKSDIELIKNAKTSHALAHKQHNPYALGFSNQINRVRSKSLEPMSKFGVWSDKVVIVEMLKRDGGLGFSILDYQDPLKPGNTMIVIRSLVPGGVAHQTGLILPGDRLVFINEVSLYNTTLDVAVEALKSIPKGKVVMGVLKPQPVVVVNSGGKSGSGKSGGANVRKNEDHDDVGFFQRIDLKLNVYVFLIAFKLLCFENS